ncbi:MAG TPA: hypothetical protein VET23_09470 [Chitinophagaceae bacterium]|nr:hypothetical protein [Chitinophagaceae bacterium]
MSQFISLQTAIEMTSLYRSQCENILKPEFQNRGILALSEAFDRAVFDAVLAEDGCEGLRIYYGMSEDLKIHAIIVGTDANGNDILPSSGAAANSIEDGDGYIIENGNRCPDICPDTSPLNS